MARTKLPGIEEMKDWDMIALRQLGGSSRSQGRHITKIDEKIRQMMLGLGVGSEECDHLAPYNKTRLGWRAENARSTMGKELIENPKKGYWRLTPKGCSRADELVNKGKKRQLDTIERKQRSQADNQTIKALADAAGVNMGKIRLLQKYAITAADLEKLLKTHSDSQYTEENEATGGVTVLPENGGTTGSEASTQEQRLEVEAKAVEHILAVETGWHKAPRNNPGFDLYKTDNGRRNGKKIVWCEVKALSESFQSVGLTPREVKEALERKEDYWLYIVENVATESPNIIPVRNPGYQPNERYRFGREWRSMSQTNH